ncbi:MAG: hypothetical protein ACUVWV_03920 [Thermodesulfobacteriota bacterium]
MEVGKLAGSKMAIVGDEHIKEGNKISIVHRSLPCGRCWFCLRVPHRLSLWTMRTIYSFHSTKNQPSI